MEKHDSHGNKHSFQSNIALMMDRKFKKNSKSFEVTIWTDKFLLQNILAAFLLKNNKHFEGK